MSSTGGTLVAQALRQEGVDVVFTLPGSHIRSILEEARRVGLRVVSVRHEENAVMMAAGYALATGRTGVAAVTAGPGLTNAVGGMGEAHASGIPVVVLAGRTAVSLRGRGAVQDLDQLQLVAAVTRWRSECLEAARVGEYVAAAFHNASAGHPGVAYLEIPEDVLGAAATGEGSGPVGFAPPARPVPESGSLGLAVDLLASAERPVALCGSGSFFSGAAAALRRFAETTGIPVVTTSAARGLLPDDHPYCLGSLVHGGAALLSSDVPLVLGSAFNANLVYGRPPLFSPDARIIQVDIDPRRLGGQRRPYLALTGDVAATLDAISEAWTHPADRWAAWLVDAAGAAQASRRQWEEETERPTEGIHPGWLARRTASFAREKDAPFVVDGGDSVIWGLAFGAALGPGRHLFLGSAMGTLGVGVPYALAAALAHGRPSVLFTGDGAFGLSALELDTARRQNVGVLVVVVNNGGWGGPGPGVRYHLLAEAVEGYGARVEKPSDVERALDEAWEAVESGRPAVVDAVCDRGVHSDFMRAMGALALM